VIDLLKETKNLFEKIGPNGTHLNPWYLQIINKGSGKEFDHKITNPNWLIERGPILEAFWHTK
jgi:hypothetical protein